MNFKDHFTETVLVKGLMWEVTLDTIAPTKYLFNRKGKPTVLTKENGELIFIIKLIGTFNTRNQKYKKFPVSKYDMFWLDKSTTAEAEIILKTSPEGIVNVNPEEAEIKINKPYVGYSIGVNSKGIEVDGIKINHILKKTQPMEMWEKVKKLLTAIAYYDTKLALKKILTEMYPEDFQYRSWHN